MLKSKENWIKRFDKEFVAFLVKDSNPNEKYQEFRRIYELPKEVKVFIETELKLRETETLKSILEDLPKENFYEGLEIDPIRIKDLNHGYNTAIKELKEKLNSKLPEGGK